MKRPTCECYDRECSDGAHAGASKCLAMAVTRLYRVDMDPDALWFCAQCADDAMDSGVFAPKDAQ